VASHDAAVSPAQVVFNAELDAAVVSVVAVARFPDESECQVAEPALWISGFKLMKALHVWRVEEGRVGGVLL
jgi:hypothetical protein